MKFNLLFKTAILFAAPLFLLNNAQAEEKNMAEKPAVEMTQSAQPAPATTEAAAPVIANQVNINTATATELQKALVGIGAKKAEAIVQYREKNGKFSSVDQLLNVQGIGKATLDKNRTRIQL